MNFDPMFLTIGLAALVVAVCLKVAQIKRKRELKRRMDEAIISARLNKARAETRGHVLAAEREWGKPAVNVGKRWDV